MIVLDARTGLVTERFDAGRCGAVLHAVSRTTLIIEVVPEYELAPGCFSASDAAHELEILDLASGRRSLLATNWFGPGVLSRDGRFAAFNDLADGDRARVVDLAQRSNRDDPGA